MSISSSPNLINIGDNVTITNLTTGGVPPYYYSYNVQQNTIYDGNNIFTFTEPGTYTISETVTDSFSDTATANTLVTVIEQQGCSGYGSININVNQTDYQKYRFISYSGSGIKLNVYKTTMWPVSINMNGAKSCLYVNSTGGDTDISSHGSFDKIFTYNTGIGSISIESYGSHNILKTYSQGYQQLSIHGSQDNVTATGIFNTSVYLFGSLNMMNLTSEHNIKLVSFGSNENVHTNGGNVTETYVGSNDIIFAFGGTIYRIVCFGNKDNLTTTGTVVINDYCGVSKGVDDRAPWHA